MRPASLKYAKRRIAVNALSLVVFVGVVVSGFRHSDSGAILIGGMGFGFAIATLIDSIGSYREARRLEEQIRRLREMIDDRIAFSFPVHVDPLNLHFDSGKAFSPDFVRLWDRRR